ncbi:MAG: hypothetical protein COA45_08630 [Zetaproteobacteria bacterium]|nr:MAG: hypothetical protein COA45_08630 [Zetaproteobacteria bacterium]
MVLKKIVITRPKAQGRAFAKSMVVEDSSCFLMEPLLEIRYLPVLLPEPDRYDGVIVTSVHGAKAFLGANRQWLEKPFYCVGESVVVALQDVGVQNIVFVAPIASDLAGRIKEHIGDFNPKLLYMRAQDVAFDFKGALGQGHCQFDELVCYEAIAVTKFSDGFITAIKNREVSAITFFSKRTAKVFLECVRVSSIQQHLMDIQALCINDSMIECLYSIFGQNIEISDTSDADGMSRIIRSFV